MINSLREFNKVHLVNINTNASLDRVLQVLTPRKSKIQSLHLATVVLTKSELINLLSTLESLNEIVVKSLTIRSLDNNNVSDDTRIINASSKVKSNEIKTSVKNLFLNLHCDRKILSVFDHLPADSLETLVLKFPTNDMKMLKKFLCKQNRLRQLTIYTNFIQSISISHLHLTHLTIEARRISIETICSQKSSLTYLCIMNFPLNDDDLFDEICNVRLLKVLKIFIGNISNDKIQSVSRLRNLTELTVKSAAKFDEEGQLAMFCSLKFPHLVKLELLVPNLNISAENLRLLGMELGDQLKSFKIDKISFEGFVVILENFDKLELLEVLIDSESFMNFNCSQIKHFNMKELIISHKNQAIDQMKWNSLFPNIQKLIINRKLPIKRKNTCF